MLSYIYIGLQVKYQLFFSHFNRTEIFSRQILEKYPNIKFHTFLQWETSCSMRTGGRTERHDKAIIRFWQFC